MRGAISERFEDKATELIMRRRQNAPIDPFKIFIQAHNFFQAQELIYETQNGLMTFPGFAIPAATLGAFSCELFLKALVCIETRKVPQGHNLRKLFDMLSKSTRNRLGELWDEYAVSRAPQWNVMERDRGRKVARDLPSALFAGSRAFEFLRYRYEEGQEFQFFLDDLPHMLGMVALELKPEWRQIIPNGISASSKVITYTDQPA
jgi:hypothetical protein